MESPVAKGSVTVTRTPERRPPRGDAGALPKASRRVGGHEGDLVVRRRRSPPGRRPRETRGRSRRSSWDPGRAGAVAELGHELDVALVDLHRHLLPAAMLRVPPERDDRAGSGPGQRRHLGAGEHHRLEVAGPQARAAAAVAASEHGGPEDQGQTAAGGAPRRGSCASRSASRSGRPLRLLARPVAYVAWRTQPQIARHRHPVPRTAQRDLGPA